MPKVVDHEQRRRELAEAVWRIVRRDGIGHASVRAVAAESGWSSGSLRHYFPTQNALLGFAMELAYRRFLARLERIDATAGHREVVRALAHEMLAVDDERRTEAAVLLSFLPRAMVEPTLHELERRGTRELYDGIAQVLTAAQEAGELRDGVVPIKAARRLVALVDGLNIHHGLGPDELTAADVVEAVDEQLDRIFA
ncbi:TetR/AcrR family transcriptional regulator [Lentzea sp. CC55]|uniref:TetR/AcrR family transcriptional regulator n=1 Tax=Lentzea sp. CC55 TaxID=2884909 RepID=UPI0027E20EFF|nr:TetR family transcriptional regulator C-terminal domain-containing protein [Lentzea sp. CC55]MCG8926864.1 TetR family transcriptional regulator C-terminal domain-containing protein [Lentzea sp. CC55]